MPEFVDPLKVKFRVWLAKFPGQERQRVAACEALLAAVTIEEMEAALEAGGYVDCYNHIYKYPTPLTSAACRGQLDQIELLVAHGADINDSSGDEYGAGTPIEAAAFQHEYDAATLLVRLGARVNHHNQGSLIYQALEEILDAFYDPEEALWVFVQVMIEHGAELVGDLADDLRKENEETYCVDLSKKDRVHSLIAAAESNWKAAQLSGAFPPLALTEASSRRF